MDRPECPECGSTQHSVRIAKPSGPQLLLENIDSERAGTYRCDHCDSRYFFEARIPEFTPKARCTFCGGYETKVMKRLRKGRYHLCLNRSCLRSFRTVDPPGAVASASGDQGNGD